MSRLSLDQSQTVQGFQEVLKAFTPYGPIKSFSEGFAVNRYLKKFQEPDIELTQQLREECWLQYSHFDQALETQYQRLLHPIWYKVRAELHRTLPKELGCEFSFPKGSEYTPNRNRVSVEQRLVSSDWSCTPDNFAMFMALVRRTAGLKRAFRKRYDSWFRDKFGTEDQRKADLLLWRRLQDPKKVLEWKLRQVVNIVPGSRFNSVPKDNTKRRPINIEPIANILTQSQIGKTLREYLLNRWSIDLDGLQQYHRIRISDLGNATIDLKNASDSMSLALVRFLLPARFLSFVEQARSPMVLAPDGDFHLLHKVSSMGNGFTFELMTVVLTTACRVLDDNATVYGDDIIIRAEMAPTLIDALESVGFVVNKDKTFTTGPFRESCGANYHAAEGYIDSFDFEWPETVLDCITIYNKCFYLRKYANFNRLLYELERVVPSCLGRGPALGPNVNRGFDESPLSETYFIGSSSLPVPRHIKKVLRRDYHVVSKLHLCYGMAWVEKLNSPMRSHLRTEHWGKYLSYLHAGRRCKDVCRNQGSWVPVQMIGFDGYCTRVSTLL